jgi:hypothetical protein
VKDDELREMRNALEARIESCWNRLDDAVEELTERHGVSVNLIVEHVQQVVETKARRDGDLTERD